MGPFKLDTLVSVISSHPAPVVLLDTCVYLDFLRNALKRDSIFGLKKFVEMIDGCAIYIVTPDIINEEYTRNIDTVRGQIKNATNNVLDGVEGIRAHLMGFATLDKSDRSPAYLAIGTGERFVSMIEDKVHHLLDVSAVFELTPDIKLKAHERQLRALRPARRGKDSSGDCSITEAFLELTKNLRSVGFMERVIFISSNLDDYGGEDAVTRRNLHPAIQSDFAPLSIEFFSNLNRAASTFI